MIACAMVACVFQQSRGISAQHGWRGDYWSLQEEATRGQQSTTVRSQSAVRVDAQCIAINVRSEYSTTLLC